DLSRKRQLRVHPGAVEIAPDQLKLADDVQRRAHPARGAVIGANLIAAVGLRLEENDRRPFVRRLRDDLDAAAAPEAAEADRGSLRGDARQRRETLRAAGCL